jgi:hypothetical protein
VVGDHDQLKHLEQPRNNKPPGAGLSLERSRLLLAAEEAETSEAVAEERKPFRHGSLLLPTTPIRTIVDTRQWVLTLQVQTEKRI